MLCKQEFVYEERKVNSKDTRISFRASVQYAGVVEAVTVSVSAISFSDRQLYSPK